MSFNHLVLAGGGHTHAVMLLRWIKYPHRKPKGLITLINRDSTTIYSSMVPGIISGDYLLEDSQINLRSLADKAGVVFVLAEIKGLNPKEKILYLEKRPDINFTQISFDIGSGTNVEKVGYGFDIDELAIPIKPFRKALKWIQLQDSQSCGDESAHFSVIGSGFASIEIIFALRKRWPNRPLNLQVQPDKPRKIFRKSLSLAKINIVDQSVSIKGPILLCTGSQVPKFLGESGLDVDRSGRVITSDTLQVKSYPHIFAVGDCGVIENFPRPPSGVWAVRAAKPLSENINRQTLGLNLFSWRPQEKALQLLGGPYSSHGNYGFLFWGDIGIGPNTFLWKLKKLIDQKFMKMFISDLSMNDKSDMNNLCRGCAAKIPSQTLEKALNESGLCEISNTPEDAVLIASLTSKNNIIQSVDGFPALLSDPWLNARLTTLHACSDIWSTGATVISAQPIITLPNVSESLQTSLLSQVLGGIKSVLDPQNANIIGGHTLESRNIFSHSISMGIDISLSVNGLIPPNQKAWKKSGLQAKDVLLISRPLGSGVLFAASMRRRVDPVYVDVVINKLNTSQHVLLETLFKKQEEQSHLNPIVHACTDITGFGLLGHLNEMLKSSNNLRIKNGLRPLKIRLQAEKIPAYLGVLELFSKGYSSTFAPSNRRFWDLFQSKGESMATFEWDSDYMTLNGSQFQQVMELIADPQTCGPLVLACAPDISEQLVNNGPWTKIGLVEAV